MRQLLPLSPTVALDKGADSLTGLLNRDARPAIERPWVLVNMVTTLDGAAALSGRSAGIGGEGDRLLFSAIRSVADLIVVGAGTARAERYGPALSGARIAIISRSLDLPTDLPLFSEADEGAPRPIVIGPTSAPADRRQDLASVADVISTSAEVTPGAILDIARDLGARTVLCEGGPTLLAQFAGADLIDEWFVTVGPMVASGPTGRIVTGAEEHIRNLSLSRVWEHDGELLLRYLRAPD